VQKCGIWSYIEARVLKSGQPQVAVKSGQFQSGHVFNVGLKIIIAQEP